MFITYVYIHYPFLASNNPWGNKLSGLEVSSSGWFLVDTLCTFQGGAPSKATRASLRSSVRHKLTTWIHMTQYIVNTWHVNTCEYMWIHVTCLICFSVTGSSKLQRQIVSLIIFDKASRSTTWSCSPATPMHFKEIGVKGVQFEACKRSSQFDTVQHFFAHPGRLLKLCETRLTCRFCLLVISSNGGQEIYSLGPEAFADLEVPKCFPSVPWCISWCSYHQLQWDGSSMFHGSWSCPIERQRKSMASSSCSSCLASANRWSKRSRFRWFSECFRDMCRVSELFTTVYVVAMELCMLKA